MVAIAAPCVDYVVHLCVRMRRRNGKRNKQAEIDPPLGRLLTDLSSGKHRCICEEKVKYQLIFTASIFVAVTASERFEQSIKKYPSIIGTNSDIFRNQYFKHSMPKNMDYL